MTAQVNSTACSFIPPSIPPLLKNVAFTVGTLREARKRYSAQLAPDFNMFNFLRGDEMGLSSAIADLLNPNGTHGQGYVFLASFVKRLGAEYDWIIRVSDWQVSTEKTISDQRRIDVYMESQTGLVAIENKPWAGHQNNQLKDYAKYLDDNKGSKKWLLIYVGKYEPSQDSIKDDFRKVLEQSKNLYLSNFYFLVDWLLECATLANALPVRLFIEDLAKFVRKEVNGEMDMTVEVEVIKEIRKSEDNFSGAFHIANAMNGLKRNLLRTFCNDLESACDSRKYKHMWDKEMSQQWSKYSGFGVRFDTTHRFYLRIEFANVNLSFAEWGIRRADKDVVKDDKVWKAIEEKMRLKFGPGKSSEVWPWWSTSSPRMRFGEGYEDWNKSALPWIEMDNGKLIERIMTLADEVVIALSDSSGLSILK